MATDELRVDYYAGAIAILAVILFTKFITHRGKSEEAAKKSFALHLACVGFAGLGAIACLCVLGWAKPNGVETVLRVAVGGLTLIAAVILIHDVTLGSGQKPRGSK